MGSLSTTTLDELMFAATGWFAIGADNQAVRGVRVPTLHTGLSLIGDGAVATIVGRLRPEIRVVDVDLAGERGHAAVEQIATWCHRAGIWHLVRPSGGTDGRAHIFIAPGHHDTDLAAAVEQTRRALRASTRAIDLRRSGHIRPLSAPHRSGHHTRALGDLRTATTALRRHLAATPDNRNAPTPTSIGRAPDSTPGDRSRPSPAASPSDRARRRGAGALGRALTPRPRRRTPLPTEWATYLRTGAAPAHGGTDHSRSTDELLATRALLRAGHTAETAWAAIAEADPRAMTKARANRRRWVTWVWNHLVEDDNHRPTPGRTSPSTDTSTLAADRDLRRDIAAARGALHHLAWSLPPRRRTAFLLVGHHVLDRIERTGNRRIPVPERDLVQDTGLSDRKTIRAALRTLAAPTPAAVSTSTTSAIPAGAPGASHQLGILHTDAWDPIQAKDASSFEFELHSTTDDGVSEIPPPSLHTPLPWQPPSGTWATLPRTCHALWRVLAHTAAALKPDELAQAAGLPTTMYSPLTASQRRTLNSALDALARAGLAHVDGHGRWSYATTLTPSIRERASQHHERLVTAVEHERAAYRRGDNAWILERARVLKTQISKRRAWWNGLDPAARERRREHWRGHFDRLSVLEQEHLKTQLAQGRLNAHIDEAARHRSWLEALPRDEYNRRVIERRRRYEALPRPLQQASVAAWDRHRTRFNLIRALPSELSATPRASEFDALPHGPVERDLHFLEEQMTLSITDAESA